MNEKCYPFGNVETGAQTFVNRKRNVGPAGNSWFVNRERVDPMNPDASKAPAMPAVLMGEEVGTSRARSFSGFGLRFLFLAACKKYCHLWSRAARVFSCGRAAAMPRWAVKLCEGGIPLTVPLFNYISRVRQKYSRRIFLGKYSKNFNRNN